MQITIYTTTSCPYCKMLKGYLTEKGISFVEKLVDRDNAAQEEMVKLSGGFVGVPFTHVKKDDGSEENIVGFDKGKVDRVLGIH